MLSVGLTKAFLTNDFSGLSISSSEAEHSTSEASHFVSKLNQLSLILVLSLEKTPLPFSCLKTAEDR